MPSTTFVIIYFVMLAFLTYLGFVIVGRVIEEFLKCIGAMLEAGKIEQRERYRRKYKK